MEKMDNHNLPSVSDVSKVARTEIHTYIAALYSTEKLQDAVKSFFYAKGYGTSFDSKTNDFTVPHFSAHILLKIFDNDLYGKRKKETDLKIRFGKVPDNIWLSSVPEEYKN